MTQDFKPTSEQIAEHNARKAIWVAAKMGLIYLCGNCHEEIYYPEKPKGFIHDCAMPRWIHKDRGYCCYNDESDGTAYPISDSELEDMHEQIMRHDWWYTDREFGTEEYDR